MSKWPGCPTIKCINPLCDVECQILRAPPATTPAKTPDDYAREESQLICVITNMRALAPSKLHPLLVVARSMMNANTEDPK